MSNLISVDLAKMKIWTPLEDYVYVCRQDEDEIGCLLDGARAAESQIHLWDRGGEERPSARRLWPPLMVG